MPSFTIGETHVAKFTPLPFFLALFATDLGLVFAFKVLHVFATADKVEQLILVIVCHVLNCTFKSPYKGSMHKWISREHWNLSLRKLT